jgi:CheY-like chemotaxis protein/HPt (histidine-containing phosphotransfer) domain-containing protein
MVMLTSMGVRGDARRFSEGGFDAYLAKPARFHELKKILSVTLGRQQKERSAPIATRHLVREELKQFTGRKVRILLAEDNITNQQVALSMLEKMGLRADAAANGVETLKALETLPYDLVLMDVQMPELDGLEATRKIRDPLSAVLNHRVPVIAMTAHAMPEDRGRCLDAGMDDYIAKPVDFKTLAAILEKWLPKHGTEEKETVIFDRVGFLNRVMEDEEIARTILDAYIEDIPRQIEALRETLLAGDLAASTRLAHTIKGASATIGGEALRAAAFEIETLAKGGHAADAADNILRLEAEYLRLKQAILEESRGE